MRAGDLVFWLGRLSDTASSEGGVLCRRHADSMVVPRNWTLDDLRDPDLHLFRPPAAVEQPRSRSRRSHSNGSQKVEQLALGVEPDPVAVSGTAVDEPPADDPGSDLPTENDPVTEPVADVIASADVIARADDASDMDGAEPCEVWTPNFDTDDDLGGLLSASSPLLARAFRGAERPRESPGAS